MRAGQPEGEGIIASAASAEALPRAIRPIASAAAWIWPTSDLNAAWNDSQARLGLGGKPILQDGFTARRGSRSRLRRRRNGDDEQRKKSFPARYATLAALREARRCPWREQERRRKRSSEEMANPLLAEAPLSLAPTSSRRTGRIGTGYRTADPVGPLTGRATDPGPRALRGKF